MMSQSLSHRESPLAQAHRNLNPAQLVALVSSYVEHLNVLAQSNPEYASVASMKPGWPGLLGNSPEHDRTQHREFAAKHLGKPRYVPAKALEKRGVEATWATAPALNVIAHLTSSEIRRGDPCGILWTGSFMREEENPSEGFFRKAVNLSEVSVVGNMYPQMNYIYRDGKRFFVPRRDLRLVHDAVTLLYAPFDLRLTVYALRLMDIILLLYPDIVINSIVGESKGTDNKVYFENRRELVRWLRRIIKRNVTAGTQPIFFRAGYSAAFSMVKTLSDIWRFAPMHMENRPTQEPLSRRTAKSDVGYFDFSALGCKKTKRWRDGVLPPLMNAVLAHYPWRRELVDFSCNPFKTPTAAESQHTDSKECPSDFSRNHISEKAAHDSQQGDMVDVTRNGAFDLIPKEFFPRGRPSRLW